MKIPINIKSDKAFVEINRVNMERCRNVCSVIRSELA